MIIINILIVFTIILFEHSFVGNDLFIVEETGRIDVYFCPKDNCSNELEKILSNSNSSKCAFYDLTNKKILEKIKMKKTEILIDEDNYKGVGIKIIKNGLMHNKFCILDEKYVVTGSFNPTQNNKNLNNLIIIESKKIAKNYLEEFEEIKNKRNKETKTTQIIFNNKTLKNFFCPDDKCRNMLLNELNEAKHNISFMTFTFTDKEIANTLSKKHEEGVIVKGIMEKFQSGKYSVYKDLHESGIKIQYSNHSAFQHNKLFIIDDKTVVTGSYNPTKAANTINDENILVLNQEDIIKKYVKFFDEQFI